MLAPRRPPTRAGAVASLVAVGLLLAGCAAQDPIVRDYRGEPQGVTPPASSAGGAPWSAWRDGAEEFTITLYGSSSCPPVATAIATGEGNSIDVTVPVPKRNQKRCVDDYTPHTTLIRTPAGIDARRSVTIQAQNIRFTLPAYAG